MMLGAISTARKLAVLFGRLAPAIWLSLLGGLFARNLAKQPFGTSIKTAFRLSKGAPSVLQSVFPSHLPKIAHDRRHEYCHR
jgi:hypothetical protein